MSKQNEQVEESGFLLYFSAKKPHPQKKSYTTDEVLEMLSSPEGSPLKKRKQLLPADVDLDDYSSDDREKILAALEVFKKKEEKQKKTPEPGPAPKKVTPEGKGKGKGKSSKM